MAQLCQYVIVANRLLTGYFEILRSRRPKRTANASPPNSDPLYFTVIAIPDGYHRGLDKSGWKDLADETQEGLFVLEPGQGGWGSASEDCPIRGEFLHGYGNTIFPSSVSNTWSDMDQGRRLWMPGLRRIH
jgi:hypothetical protein